VVIGLKLGEGVRGSREEEEEEKEARIKGLANCTAERREERVGEGRVVGWGGMEGGTGKGSER
jgi:hypothetical protein